MTGLLTLPKQPKSNQGGGFNQDGMSGSWADSSSFSGSDRIDSGGMRDRIDSGMSASGRSGGKPPVFALNDNALSNLQYRQQYQRTDAGRSVFPYGDLTHVMDKVLLQRHPPLTALKHFPVNREAGWSEFWEYYSMNDYGSAKIICCSDDFPRVAIDGCTWRGGFVTIGTGYSFCYETLKAEETSRRRIRYQINLLRVAIRALREKANQLAFHGDIARSVLGLLNNPFIPRMISPFRIDNTQTAIDILSLLSEAACQAYVSSRMAAFLPNAVIGPPSIMRGLAKRLMSITGDSPASVLQQWSLFAPNLTWWGEAHELEDIGNGERAMFFYRRDPSCIEWHFPISIEILEPYVKGGFEFEQNLISRVGSLWTYYPEDTLLLTGV